MCNQDSTTRLTQGSPLLLFCRFFVGLRPCGTCVVSVQRLLLMLQLVLVYLCFACALDLRVFLLNICFYSQPYRRLQGFCLETPRFGLYAGETAFFLRV